jgi:uncharacterized Zn finger protein
MSWYGYRPYVPVAVRRARALKKTEKLRNAGIDIKPVEIQGRTIARTFWGQAWCDHMESFSDFENRLPRGRTYVRNGSVCHLGIEKGLVSAMVSGSHIYNVQITIDTLAHEKWKQVRKSCAGQIGSLLELLQGKFSRHVMSVVTDRSNGLFPMPKEIQLHCSCPDWAIMCKHVAAVLYGVAARLDEDPSLLFLLRGVDHQELIAADIGVDMTGADNGRRTIGDESLADVFGIELCEDGAAPSAEASTQPEKGRGRRKNAQHTDNGRGKTPRTLKQPAAGAASEPASPKGAAVTAPSTREPVHGPGAPRKSKSKAKARPAVTSISKPESNEGTDSPPQRSASKRGQGSQTRRKKQGKQVGPAQSPTGTPRKTFAQAESPQPQSSQGPREAGAGGNGNMEIGRQSNLGKRQAAEKADEAVPAYVERLLRRRRGGRRIARRLRQAGASTR